MPSQARRGRWSRGECEFVITGGGNVSEEAIVVARVEEGEVRLALVVVVQVRSPSEQWW